MSEAAGFVQTISPEKRFTGPLGETSAKRDVIHGGGADRFCPDRLLRVLSPDEEAW
ncbi:hypothetical protein [Polyangium aurulentum]|uniref:hypothetical protein n=1 Tax=Polyangium aurulentum TaxID=2567896 RepID=UPI00146D4829|nr:hypothetical protein [Polyangium aurulentum]UQA56349.1 hypothetical protein E8A73_034285 [Polyangium aurulentum]